MAEPSTLAEAETYTRQVADLLKAAEELAAQVILV